MEISGYSENTIAHYLSCVRVFAFHFNKSPLLISTLEIEAFFHHLRKQRKSESTIHLYYVSLRFFYRQNNMLDRMPRLTFPKVRNKIPLVLSQEKMISMLDSCKSLKYKTLFTLAYASGLRVSELQALTVPDIDFDRKQVYVRNGKNGRNRYSLLGIKTIELLRFYINVYRPSSFLFYSRADCTSRLGEDAIRRELKKLLINNGIDSRQVHMHTLRHCFATHLMENGTSIFHVMQLLGHVSIITTMVYLHMQNLDKLHIRSPIDLLESHPTDDRKPPHELFAAIA
jgi:site-specific recombinase XerD